MKTCIPVLLLTTVLAAGTLPAQAQQVISQSPSPSQSPLSQPTASDIETSAQQFVDLLAAGDYTSARGLYDANVNVTPTSIQQTWEDILANSGAYQSQLGARIVPLENPVGGTIAIVGVKFADATRALFITFNSDRKIVSLDVVEETN
jgi:Protein of unknown function (DUF3887)